MGRGDLTNAEWDRLESFLPPGGARGGRWSDHRRVINGVLYRVRTGVQWRDLPERFGPWETVHKRHRRWSADGTWKMLLSRIQAAEDAAGGIDWDVSVDSTAVRAHQHAAGARKAPAAAVPEKGAGRGTNQRSGAAETGRPAGGGSQIGECLGRSRGGLTTKIHLVAEGRCRPLAFVLTPGHYGDGPQLERVLAQVSVPRTGVGRPRTRPDHVLADKAYTSRNNRRYLRRRGIRHTIPERLDQQRHRQNRGSRGGRPTGFDSERYKKRNTVERAINRLKGFRAVATRYEKRAYIYLGTVTLAALVIWLRT
ncbi:IS5 family transposase [Streptomyces sp. NRRL B-24720]|uniref:IS5 family transposase n=1 Tax=Streptomyces sp. NRRL B-24720 TaxID=1476876 RepID=UPI003B633764